MNSKFANILLFSVALLNFLFIYWPGWIKDRIGEFRIGIVVYFVISVFLLILIYKKGGLKPKI